MTSRAELAAAWGIDWFPYQLEALDGEAGSQPASLKACLYFRTGAGKTYTSLALMAQAGVQHVLVVAPPATHPEWQKVARAAGIDLTCMSHAKYRQPGMKFSRQMAVIIDEFHMLGGHEGTGWKRLRVHARSIQAPLVILSATPNYNDAERVYCIEHVLDPASTKGGWLEWIYKNCVTKMNPFGQVPLIEGWQDGKASKDHLAALPHVYYVEDENENFPIADIVLPTTVPDELIELGIDRRRERIVASRMEAISASRKYQLIDDVGLLRPEVYEELAVLVGNVSTPTMVFCARAEIARAAHDAAVLNGVRSGLVVYEANTKKRDNTLRAFKSGELDVLFGTATMATGVDGLDKVCDQLILLDDTDDPSLRRQVIGRILPRGMATDVSKKIVVRLLLGVT